MGGGSAKGDRRQAMPLGCGRGSIDWTRHQLVGSMKGKVTRQCIGGSSGLIMMMRHQGWRLDNGVNAAGDGVGSGRGSVSLEHHQGRRLGEGGKAAGNAAGSGRGLMRPARPQERWLGEREGWQVMKRPRLDRLDHSMRRSAR